MADDLSDRIESVANAPASASGDAGSVTQQSIDSLIKADQYLQGKAAAAKKHRGLRFTRLKPPGAVGDNTSC